MYWLPVRVLDQHQVENKSLAAHPVIRLSRNNWDMEHDRQKDDQDSQWVNAKKAAYPETDDQSGIAHGGLFLPLQRTHQDQARMDEKYDDAKSA
jgi:hypothetical protein